MPIVATCSHCHTSFEAKDRLADKMVHCPKCGEALRISSGAATPGAKTFRGAPPLSRNLGDDVEIPIRDPLADRAAHGIARRKNRRKVIFWVALVLFLALIGIGIAVAYGEFRTIELPTTGAGSAAVPAAQ